MRTPTPTPTPTPSGEIFAKTQKWCPHCSGDSKLQDKCNHEQVVEIDCPEPGTLIAGDYEYISLLGCGGMGIVYKCRNVHLDKIVAVKMLISRRYGPDEVVRFQKEARAAGKFNHPNLVSVLDFGITSNAEPFMVMEFLNGKTLADLIDENNLDVEVMVAIFKECSIGLNYAHQQGVLHRDLKPANIMILDRGGNLNVKILDFGIAKIADAGKFEHTLSTMGLVFGTPAYMSPEQTSSAELNDRCDVYSMGCVMYEAFAGKRPFEASSALELIGMHRFEVPQLIGARAPQRVFPEELESLIATMLAKDPQQRPDMKSVAVELDKILEQLRAQRLRSDLSLAQPSADAPALTLDKKSQLQKIGMIICLVVVIIGVVFFVFRDTSSHRSNGAVRLNEPAVMKISLVEDVELNRDHMMKEVSQQMLLDEIKIRDDRIFPEPLKLIVTQAKNCERIRFLDCSNLTAENLKILSQSNIRNVAIEGTEIKNDALDVLADFKSLEGLELSEVSGIDHRGIASLKRAPHLKRLNFRLMPISSEIIRAVSEFKIEMLELSNIQGFDETSFSLLQKTPISELRLRNLDVTDIGVEMLSKITSLTRLQANGLQFTNRGLQHLRNMPKLNYLNISDNKGITDGACKTLAEILAKSAEPSEVEFLIAQTSITKASVPDLKQLKGVRLLDLSGLKGFNPKVMKELQEALPGTNLKHSTENRNPDTYGILSN